MQMNSGVLLIGTFLSGQLGVRGISEDLAQQLIQAGWRVLTTSEKLGRLARLRDMLWTIWRWRHKYAVAHVEVYSGAAFRWAEAVCWLLRQLHKPYLLTLHGGNLPEFARHQPERVRYLLRSAIRVTTPSQYLQEQLATYHDDLILLPNPLQIVAYEFKPRTQPAPKLVWLRAFHSIYNPALAAHVLARLVHEFPGIHLLMVGPDKGDGSVQEFQRTAEQLNVANHVSLSGAVPKTEIPAYLHRGDIFLNTTNVDNTPVSVLEALACGLCVVSTKAGGIPYLLEHERDALLVPVNDAVAMALAVRRLLTEPGLAAELSYNAREKASRYDWSTILPQWEQLLKAAIQNTVK